MSMVNILKNPSFESGLANWATHCTYSGNLIQPVSNGGKNGACIKLTVPPEKGQSFIQQVVKLAPGIHTAKFFAKRTSGNVDVWISVRIGDQWQHSASFIPKLSTSYTELSYSFTVNGSSKQDVYIRFIAGSAEGVAWFDETSLMVNEEDVEDENPLELGVRYYADVSVNSDGLRVRSQPNTNASVLGYWPNGRLAVVEAIEGNKEWVSCRWKNKSAYVSKAYMKNFRAIPSIWNVASILNNVGTSEKLADSHAIKFYGPDLGYQPKWCHYFADWIAGHCLWEHYFIPDKANCLDGVIAFLDKGSFAFANEWHKSEVFSNTSETKKHMSSGALDSFEQRYDPSAGDYVYFRKCPDDSGYNASETSYHVGVVVSSTQFGDGFRVTVIEGNTSGSNTIDGVGFKTYDPTPGTGEGKGGRYHKNILGFGFANGLG